jgi:hypothetical protein
MKRILSAATLFALLLVVREPVAAAVTTSSIGYVTDTFGGRMLRVNLATGQAQSVGSFVNVTNIGGLAYDSSRHTLFGVSPMTDALYSINLATGEASFVGGFGVGNITMQGAAYDPVSQRLFATATNPAELFTINPDTGQAQLVGAMGQTISGLAVNPLTGDLYGSPASLLLDDKRLFLIDKSTAAITPIGNHTVGYNGLAFDADGTLYGVRNNSNNLYRIDLVDAASTLIGPLGVAGINSLGFEIIPVPEPSGALLVWAGMIGTASMCRGCRRFGP